jgi:peptidoglycan/LPS O-acetylase OafA/YrhL
MGYLRLALAVSVVVAHLGPEHWRLFPANAAVQSFYLISGFYIFYILEKKYASIGSFYLNRFLRLYPSYLTVLLLSVILSVTIGTAAHFMTVGEMAEKYASLTPFSAIFVLFSNASMLFQDLIMFLKIGSDGQLAFSPDFYLEADPAYRLLILPQAWSLSLEITFYLFAPLLVRLSSWQLVLVATGCFLARLYTYSQGLQYDPWNYRVFPFEAAMFIIGGLMFRTSEVLRGIPVTRRLSTVLVVTLLAYCVFYPALPNWRYQMFIVKYDAFLFLLAASLPFLFVGQQYAGLNKFLGELSFPLYLNHLFALNLAKLFFPSPVGAMFFGSAIALLLSVIMVKLIEEPTDRMRQKLVLNRLSSRIKIANCDASPRRQSVRLA